MCMFGAVGGCRSIVPEACEEKSGNLLCKNQLVACSNVRAGWRHSGDVDGGEGGGEGGGRLAAVEGSWGRV